MWTYGESHPGLVHAMDACYCYTIGPNYLNITQNGQKSKLLGGPSGFDLKL